MLYPVIVPEPGLFIHVKWYGTLLAEGIVLSHEPGVNGKDMVVWTVPNVATYPAMSEVRKLYCNTAPFVNPDPPFVSTYEYDVPPLPGPVIVATGTPFRNT